MTDRRQLDELRADRGALVRALEDAGAHVDGDKVRCGFHDDKHPSGGIHEHNGTWLFTCHGCTWNGAKRSGDVVDVVKRARGLDFRGALSALGVNGDGPPAGGNGASSRATAPGGVSGRGRSATGQGGDSGDVVDAAGLAADNAARLQGDKGALATLWTTRAVDGATAERFGVGVSADGRWWTFPAPGGGVVAVKHHRTDPGTEPKCVWEPKGAHGRRVFPVSLDAPGPVWVCGGELKALAVASAGRSAVAMTCGENADPWVELADVLQGRAVAVVADDDKDGRKWGHATYKVLTAAGIDVRSVDLGLSKADGLKDVGDWIVSRVGDGKEPAEIAAELDAAYERADPWRAFTLAGIWTDKATWGPVYHVPTGLRELDDGLGGGLRVGGVHLFCGKSGRAKTQTVCQLALNAARSGVPVGFVSLEMSRRDVAHLVAANLADVPRSWLADGHLRGEPAERVQRVLREHAGLPLAVVDDGFWTGALTRSGLVRVVGDGCARFGWRLVVLDYLGLLGNEQSDASEYAADLENSAALKRLARVQDVALVVVAALRKYGRKDDAPTSLDDVLGAGRLCYDAVNVLNVDCEQAPCEAGTRPAGLVRLYPLKTRYAGLASAGRELQFRWFPGIGRVCNLEPERTFDDLETRRAGRLATGAESGK